MSTNLVDLLTPETTIKVSSTLEKSVGKKNLTDNNPETCWTSQQGLPQSIQVTFPERVVPRRVSLTFQGGFVGTRCSIHVSDFQAAGERNKKNWQLLTHVYPEDVNRRQSFELTSSKPSLLEGMDGLKLVFEESSDFFGRIVVYDLKLEGTLMGS